MYRRAARAFCKRLRGVAIVLDFDGTLVDPRIYTLLSGGPWRMRLNALPLTDCVSCMYNFLMFVALVEAAQALDVPLVIATNGYSDFVHAFLKRVSPPGIPLTLPIYSQPRDASGRVYTTDKTQLLSNIRHDYGVPTFLVDNTAAAGVDMYVPYGLSSITQLQTATRTTTQTAKP